MALVDVLVNVLDGLDGCNPLEIDVTAVFPDEVRAVRHYPVVVNILSIDLECSSCITTTKDSIRVLSESSMISERLWKVLGALLCLLIHAWGCWIVNTTGTMDHELLDQLQKLWLGVWIGELCREKTVYVLRSAEFAFR